MPPSLPRTPPMPHKQGLEGTESQFFASKCADSPNLCRLVYPGPPANDYGAIYISTNPSTRKVLRLRIRTAAEGFYVSAHSFGLCQVAQLRANPASALSYTAKDWQAYVTLIGSASIIDDPEVLRKHWREDLLVYYAGGPLGSQPACLSFQFTVRPSPSCWCRRKLRCARIQAPPDRDRQLPPLHRHRSGQVTRL